MSPPAAKRRRIDEKHGFPESFLYYLKKNAKTRLLLKLMQASKYFCYKKFHFMVIKDLEYVNNWKYIERENQCYQPLDMENVSKPLWITDYLYCHDPPDPKLASKLVSKIAVCDAEWIRFDSQILTFDEFNFFACSNNISTLEFCYSHVEYDDGSAVPVEEMLKCLPKLDFLEWSLTEKMQTIFTQETTKEIIKTLSERNFDMFCLNHIPQPFDFKLFAEFMDANPTVDFELDFSDPITPEYRRMLQDYVDKIIETEEHKLRIMLITFPGQTDESFEVLLDWAVN